MVCVENSHELQAVHQTDEYSCLSEPGVAFKAWSDLPLGEPLQLELRIKIIEKVQPAIPEALLDENQITQAMLNLMLNAIQFSPQNSGLVEIGASWNAQENELNLWVQDNGPGLSPEQRRNMFVTLLTDRFRTMDHMMAFCKSVNLIINKTNIADVEKILSRSTTEFEMFYRIYHETMI